MARPGASWKVAERNVAEAFGTKRHLEQGRNSPDVRLPGWSLEVKKRKRLPAWLHGFMKQARANVLNGDLPAVVMIETRPGVKAKRLVMMDFDAFVVIVEGLSGRAGLADAAESAVEAIADGDS